MKNLLTIAFAGWLCLPLAAQADIAPEPMSGGISLATPGQSQTEIALWHNTVKIHVASNLCRTRAFFRLHNTGPATELEVGFPLIHEGEAADFKVFIDGEPVSFKYKTKADKTPIGQPITLRWKAWTMKFERGETHLVEVRYSNPPAPTYSFLVDDAYYNVQRRQRETGFDYDLSDYGYPEPIKLGDWLGVKSVEYILVTGSYWKGPIERCRVEVDIENIATETIFDVRPPAKSFSPRRIVWEWQNIEPPRNISLTFVSGLSPRQTLIPYMAKIAAQNPQDEKVQSALAQLKNDFSNEQQSKARQKSFVQAR